VTFFADQRQAKEAQRPGFAWLIFQRDNLGPDNWPGNKGQSREAAAMSGV
jgi:hypothetical protein